MCQQIMKVGIDVDYTFLASSMMDEVLDDKANSIERQHHPRSMEVSVAV